MKERLLMKKLKMVDDLDEDHWCGAWTRWTKWPAFVLSIFAISGDNQTMRQWWINKGIPFKENSSFSLTVQLQCSDCNLMNVTYSCNIPLANLQFAKALALTVQQPENSLFLPDRKLCTFQAETGTHFLFCRLNQIENLIKNENTPSF